MYFLPLLHNFPSLGSDHWLVLWTRMYGGSWPSSWPHGQRRQHGLLDPPQCPARPGTRGVAPERDEGFPPQVMNNRGLCGMTKKEIQIPPRSYALSLQPWHLFWFLWLQLLQIRSLNHLQPLFQITPPHALFLKVPVTQVDGFFPAYPELAGSCSNMRQNSRSHCQKAANQPLMPTNPYSLQFPTVLLRDFLIFYVDFYNPGKNLLFFSLENSTEPRRAHRFGSSTDQSLGPSFTSS